MKSAPSPRTVHLALRTTRRACLGVLGAAASSAVATIPLPQAALGGFFDLSAAAASTIVPCLIPLAPLALALALLRTHRYRLAAGAEGIAALLCAGAAWHSGLLTMVAIAFVDAAGSPPLGEAILAALAISVALLLAAAGWAVRAAPLLWQFPSGNKP